MSTMESAIFAVGDEPYCLWEEDVAARTREFLSGFDPDFFTYLLEVHSAAEDEKRASVGLRLAVHHATETLFSLLGAFIQAWDCPYAWIARCSNSELRSLVQRISKRDASLVTKLRIPSLCWEDVSRAVFHHYESGTSKQEQTIQFFARTWASVAGELLLKDVAVDEYNATKHGFRTRAGGFKLAIAREEAPGIPAPSPDIRTIGQSEFGARYYKVEKLAGKGGRHLRSRRIAVNWSLERDILLLQLVQFSIANVLSALRIANGFPVNECEFVRPQDDEDFRKPWKYSTGVSSMSFDFVLDESQLPNVTKVDIMSNLRQNQ